MPADYWQKTLPVRPIKLLNDLFVVPAFSVPNVPGVDVTGASLLFAKFVFPQTAVFSLIPEVAAVSADFVLAVSSRGNRYLLYSGVGEILNLPAYKGEALYPGALLEAWTAQKNTQTISSDKFIIELGTTSTQLDFRTPNQTSYAPASSSFYPFS